MVTIFPSSFHRLVAILQEIYKRPSNRYKIAKRLGLTPSQLSQYLAFCIEYDLVDEEVDEGKRILSVSLSGYDFLKACENIKSVLGK